MDNKPGRSLCPVGEEVYNQAVPQRTLAAPTCSNHSGTALYETYVAGRSNMDVYFNLLYKLPQVHMLSDYKWQHQAKRKSYPQNNHGGLVMLHLIHRSYVLRSIGHRHDLDGIWWANTHAVWSIEDITTNTRCLASTRIQKVYVFDVQMKWNQCFQRLSRKGAKGETCPPYKTPDGSPMNQKKFYAV